MLLPLAVANAFTFGLVTQGQLPFHEFGTVGSAFDFIYVYATAGIVLLDAYLNRQPYYASFHSFCGVFICFAYLLFNIIFVCVGGLNEEGRNTIYPGLRWHTRSLELWFTGGKITFIEFLVFLPILNSLYWCMLWARRRARVAQKQAAV